jgi:arginyl-tRNA--protein-N-Asp/Glu arginylyltransferase
MAKAKAASLDDEALFTATPHPLPGVAQRVIATQTAPAVVPAERTKYVDLNFKVRPEIKRRVKDLAYKLDCKHIQVLERALSALDRELAVSEKAK